jgi:hypothetical protein
VNSVTEADAAQCATGVLLVRPHNFGHNEQTAVSNRFQRASAQSESTGQTAAAEFERLASALTESGMRVCVVEDTTQPVKPDAVFPNNWVSFHRDGTIVLYPMLAPNRRLERRPEVLAAVEHTLRFNRSRLLDLSAHELAGRYLEGTGSMVLDHVQKVAYACRSARTDESVLREWASQLGYEPLLFDAIGAQGKAIYHTNVLMSIGTSWAIVCTEVIAACDRSRVVGRLRQGRTLIEISPGSMAQFAANILELRKSKPDQSSRRVLVMSESAHLALQREAGQGWDRLRSSVDEVLTVAVPTIENVGGGGVRCMLAEVPEVKM